MDDCKYEVIPKVNSTKIKKTVQWKLFLRQCIVCSGVWTSMFVYGLGVGAPTVYIPQIRREANSTNVITDEMASWLTSIYGFSGFGFVLILSICARYAGRKIPFIIAAIDSLAAFIVLYCSSNVTHILISAVMQGFLSATQIVISIMILTEYTSPEYRGIFLVIKSATFYWGIWVSNAIGTFFHWKNIPLFGIVCTIYIIMTILIWPESPYWLASKGKFIECAASHRWLKGSDQESEKELEALINSQNEYITMYNRVNMSVFERITDFYQTIKSKDFYKPTLISFATGALSAFSGKLVCSVYALDILSKITSNESTAYTGMLALDGITVFSMYLGCILAKYLKRRTLLLVASYIGVIFLFVLSLYLYLMRLGIIADNSYVSISLLTTFSIAVSCGPLSMSISVYGELIPMKSRNLSVFLIALAGKLLLAILLKTAPYLFKTLGLHGVFLFFGITSMILILILYKYLPETKDKTIQEITNSIIGVKQNVTKDNVFLNKNTC